MANCFLEKQRLINFYRLSFMNEEKRRSVDKVTGQYIESIKREIARHPRVLDQAIRRNDVTQLKKAYLPLILLHRKITAEINAGLLEVSRELQKILTISRKQINDLQALSQLKFFDIKSILDFISVKTAPALPAWYSSAVSHGIQLNLLEYSNLDSIAALLCTNTWLWDMLNSRDSAYIWKKLAGIYFNRDIQKDTIDSRKKFKQAFCENYQWKYATSDDFDPNPDYKKNNYSHYLIKRKGLLFRKAVEGGLISAVKSKEFKENFKTYYADPLASSIKKVNAKNTTFFFIPHPAVLHPKLEKPFIWQDFLDHVWLLNIELNQYTPQGILYEIQGLYEKTHKQKYKEELDYIFDLAIKESSINLEAIITQFALGLIEPNEQLRGTEQERAQFFYVVYLAMRCYQTTVIDQLLAKGFRVDEAVVYGVARHWRLIDSQPFRFPRKYLRIMNMLDMAIETYSFKMIDYLISQGVDINATAAPEYITSLSLEVRKLTSGDRANTAMLQFLLKRPGVNPNLAGNQAGITPLHWAVWPKFNPSSIANQCKIVQLLIDHRADVNIRLWLGITPLHCTQYYAVAEILIANKADVNAEYDVGLTPLYSMIRGAIVRLERQEDPQVSIDIARLLCQSGANVNKQLPDGSTLLQMTADAARQMPGQTAKQKLKELFTVLQTTTPVQKKVGKEASPLETKMIPSGRSWMRLFNRTPGIQKLEEKVKTDGKKKQSKSMNNSFG
jgi:ankyrin repeat protein